jgi:hypothetical protein
MPQDIGSGEGRGLTATLSEGAARALVTGHLEAILTHRKDIISMNTEEISRLAELARATRYNCGGNACG